MKIFGIEQKDNTEKHDIKWWGWILLIILIVGTYFVYREQHPNTTNNGVSWTSAKTQKCEGMVFGTIYHITYEAESDMQGEIEMVLQEVDNSLSPFNKESIISAINDGRDTTVNEMFTDVFTLAEKIYKDTDGAFDITVAPLVNLWGFGFKNIKNVNEVKVDSLMTYVGLDKVQLKDRHIQKSHKETMLDCGAIAKGYGVDAVGKFLEKNNVKNYMVEIGGEVRVRGKNPKGQLWKIGINKPVDDSLSLNRDIEQVLKISDLSMATSGNYRNFYIKGGKKYAHTIDPRTGYPVQHNILSSTVIASDCATADAYATSFMVLGLEESKKILERHKELMAFFICAGENGETEEWMTDNIKEYISE